MIWHWFRFYDSAAAGVQGSADNLRMAECIQESRVKTF